MKKHVATALCMILGMADSILAEPKVPPNLPVQSADKPSQALEYDALQQGVAAASSDNPIREPGQGPKVDVAAPDKGAAGKSESLVPDSLKGPTDRNASLQEAANVINGSTTAASPVDSRLNDDKTKRPAFDQGLGERPDVTQQDVDNVKDASNPVGGLSGGGGLQGPLADSAKESSGVLGIGQQGLGAISDDQTDIAVSGVVAAMAVGNAIPAVAPVVDVAAAGFAVGTFLDKASGGALSSVGVPGPNETTKLDILTEIISTNAVNANREEIQQSKKLPITEQSKKLPITVTTTTTVFGENGAPGETKTTTTTVPPGGSAPAATPAQPGVDTPADDTAPLKFDIVNTTNVAEQIRQSQIVTGGGVTDPTRGDDATGGPVGGPTSVKGLLPQDTQNVGLVGQPTGPGVVNESGGNKGLNPFTGSTGSGVVTPTDDTVITTGGIEQNPGDALDQGPGPDKGLQNPLATPTPTPTPSSTLTPIPTALAKPKATPSFFGR